MVLLSSSFIGDFKSGDNIHFNFAALHLLYRNLDSLNDYEKRYLLKPIIIILVSIIEAALWNLITRIRRFTFEGVMNVTTAAITTLRDKEKGDKLGKYISIAENFHWLDSAGPDIYNALRELRTIRNRIHIQNTKNELEANESDVFTLERKLMAEKTLEIVFKILALNHPRPQSMTGYVPEFNAPWVEHFPPPRAPNPSNRDYEEFFENWTYSWGWNY